MFNFFILIILTTLLSAGATKNSVMSVSLGEKTFDIKSKKPIFDTSVGYTHKKLLSCSPSIDAVYRIISDRKLRVIPQKDLKWDTVYSCKYKRESFKFRTNPLTVKDYHFFKYDNSLRLVFNGSIDLKDAEKHIKLKKIDKLASTDLKYAIIQKNDKAMVLKIKEPIGNSPLLLEIDNLLLSKSFSVKINDKGQQKVVLSKNKEPYIFTDPPRMISLSNGEFAIRIFSQNDLSNLENYIEIKGVNNFSLLHRDVYIYDYEMIKRFNLKDSQVYYDITSNEFVPNKTYTLILKKGLPCSYEKELKEDKEFLLKTGDRARMVTFNDEKPYISSAGEIGFSSVNVGSATIIVERVLDDNIRYFMNFSFANRGEVLKYTKEILSKKIVLRNIKNKLMKHKILLSDIAAKKLSYGVYRVTMRYLDGEEEKSTSRILFLSNLGISVRLSKNQAFVTVLALNSAKPILSAEVEIYGNNNELLGTARTDFNGVAIINKKGLLEKKPQGVIVKTEYNQNFLALNRTVYSPNPNNILRKKERFRGHIYLQSELIRPNGELNGLIIVKDRDFISASKLPIKLVLRNEEQFKVVKRDVYHTDEYGLIDFNYKFDNVDGTGHYSLSAYIGDTRIGTKNFKVEAFVPPKIENHISLSNNEYWGGELIEANISSNYLFGMPSAKLNGTVTLDSKTVEFRDKKYPNYSFINDNMLRNGFHNYLKKTQNIKLDKNGRSSVIFATNINRVVPSILKLSLGVTIMDDTQPVSKYKTLYLYPYREMVGIRLLKHQLSDEKKILEGDVVLINPKTKEKVDRELFAVIKKINWQYSYLSDGRYEWNKEVIVVDSFPLKSNGRFKRAIADNGEYLIEVYDRLGGHSSSSYFDVWSWGYSNISPKNNLKTVEIKFKDKLYKKGDKIEVTIKSPILKGELFVTLQGKKVEYYKHITIEKGVAKLEIPIKFDLGRGVYLNAVVYRPSNTSSMIIPFRAMGSKFVKPNRDNHRIKINLIAPKYGKSNSMVKLKVETDRESKVLISVVDKGIIQLARQKTPKIFDYFNQQPKKQISYYDLYDQLTEYIAKGKLIDFGAGDLLFQSKHLAPDFGDSIKPFMKWSKIIDNPNKKVTADIEIPEFNGKVDIVVIAISKDSVGVVSKEITIKDDIMIKPSYPKYLLNGDIVDVPVRIFNTTQKEANITVDVELSDNLKFNLRKKTVTVPPNSYKLINGQLKARGIGKSRIKIKTKFKDSIISRTVELPIYNPYVISTKTFKGVSTKSKSFTIPKKYRGGKIYVTISDNLIGSMRDDLKYIIDYPYGCAEQTTSKISAMYNAKPFLKNDELIDKSEFYVNQGIKKLGNLQNYYGEFSYWNMDGYVNPYASLYTAETLLELKRDGIEIDKSMIRKTIKMLNSVATKNDEYEGKYSNVHRVYAGYILAENNELSDSTLNMLLEKKIYKEHFLSTLYMSAILKIKSKDVEAEKMFNSLRLSLKDYKYKKYGNRSGNFESNIRDMLLHFIIKTKYFKKEMKDLITVQRSLNDLDSTQEKAVALKAISLYLGKPKDSKLDVKLKIGKKVMNITEPTTFMLDDVKAQTIYLTPKSGAMSYNIEVVKHLPKKVKNRLSSKKTLSIVRKFVHEDKSPVNLSSLKQGELIFSKVTVGNIGRINSVVVNQRIPACLTIARNEEFSIKNIEEEYRDIRDDRVLNFINLNERTDTRRKTVQNRGTILTPLMVTTKGQCKLPAIIAEAMYDTEINDYAKERNLIMIK